MVSNEIWLDSQATVSMIPEQDIYLGAFLKASTTGNQTTLTVGRDFMDNFILLENLYRGCMLDIYTVSGNTLTDRTMIQSNGDITVTVLDSIASAITTTPTNYYGVITHYGAPVPAPKSGTTTSNDDIEEVTTFTFDHTGSFALADFHEAVLIFDFTATEDGGTSTTFRIGLENGSGTGTFSPAVDVEIDIGSDTDEEDIVDGIIAGVSNSGFTLTKSGSGAGTQLVVTRTNSGDIDTEASCSNAHISVATTTIGYEDANPRLLADNWLGLATSVTVPTTSIEPKQINVGLGGTRNFTYQFKGQETTSEFSMDLMANSFPWLYYALGTKSVSSSADAHTDDTPTTNFATTGSIDANATRFFKTNAGDRIIRAENDTGSSAAGKFCPPLLPAEIAAGELINEDDAANDLITYSFSESNSSDLPSFAIEYLLRKPGSTTLRTDANKEDTYVKIFPGCTVNNLQLTAAAGQEVTCNVSAMPKTTFVAPTNYEPSNGVSDVANFVNFGTRDGEDTSLSGSTIMEPLMRPFFFSDGTIELFEQEFLKIENFTLTIDNALQQKRFIGRFDKRSQESFASQRTYNIQLTGLVTDASLFDHFRQEHAFSLSGTDGSEVILRFTKENGEQLEIKFEDYHVTQADFPLTNDNGPLVVTWTIVPLALKSCELQTYWAIQG
jgi:hypothetical protein